MTEDIDKAPFQRQREETNPPNGTTDPLNSGRAILPNFGGGSSYRVRGRSYKCPNCHGEFDAWDKRLVNPGKKDFCPFCSLERGTYDPEEADR